MILYRLTCKDEHDFEGWFRDSAACDAQLEAGSVSCPLCGSTDVGKALMAPNVTTSRDAEAARAKQVAIAGKMLRELRELRRKVEADCTYVGPRFAEEARKMHLGESEATGIYGETTAEEAEALAEEGIEFGRIPWVPLADS